MTNAVEAKTMTHYCKKGHERIPGNRCKRCASLASQASAARRRLAPKPCTVADVDRFLRHVRNAGDCWLWEGAKNKVGYGQFRYNAKNWAAHRWWLHHCVKPVPDTHHVDHLCRVIACVRPDHLEPVLPRTNLLRGQGAAAQNARKKHCLKGHAFTTDTKNNRRRCKACDDEKRAKKLAKQETQKRARGWVPEKEKTRCVNGHEYTEANTMRGTNGRRKCRACNNARTKTSYRARNPEVKRTPSKSDVCKRGHKIAGQNALMSKQQHPICRVCIVYGQWRCRKRQKGVDPTFSEFLAAYTAPTRRRRRDISEMLSP